MTEDEKREVNKRLTRLEEEMRRHTSIMLGLETRITEVEEKIDEADASRKA